MPYNGPAPPGPGPQGSPAPPPATWDCRHWRNRTGVAGGIISQTTGRPGQRIQDAYRNEAMRPHPGLMGMADVQPSGMEFKAYDPTEPPTPLSLLTVIQIAAFVGLVVSVAAMVLR